MTPQIKNVVVVPLPESGKEEQVKAKDERSLKIID